MNIFNNLDYRSVLKNGLQHLKLVKPSATLEKLADYCRIQKTYLSKVLNHGGNLNTDQIYLAAEYLGFNQIQTEFLFLIHDYDQCSVEKRKKELLKKIQKIQKDQLNTQSHLKVKSEELQIEVLQEYYADPYHQIIHIFLTIKEYQENPKLIQEKLNLTNDKFQDYLHKLIKMNVINLENKIYKSQIDNLHLPSNSSLMKAYRTMTRIQALQKLNTLSDENSYNFTVVFSTDQKTREKIHQNFLEFLKETQKIVSKSHEEDVFQINFDLLKWS
jgi:uncharacterized protein (TIGR02147 family)